MTDIADRKWRLIREEARPGPLNMALDEVAAETAASGGPRTVRLYQWEPSCLSMGYGQAPETVDWEFCETEGIDVTRRQTGGGGIYHDNHGDISYSITAPAEELPGELMECYHLLCPPVLDGFARVGVDADFVEEARPALYEPACYLRALHPAHDVVADGGTGRKLAGNAQYRQKQAVIQHGSITYDATPERHLGVFSEPGVTPDEFSERVAGITDLVDVAERSSAGNQKSKISGDVTREEAVEAFTAALAGWCDAEEGEWTDEELARGREIAAEKYGSDAWVREREGSER